MDFVYLCGSYACGHPKPYSDVDIAVVSPAFGKNVVAETAMVMEIFDPDAKMIIEPRVYSREEFEAAVPGTFLHDEVIRKGIKLWPESRQVRK